MTISNINMGRVAYILVVLDTISWKNPFNIFKIIIKKFNNSVK